MPSARCLRLSCRGRKPSACIFLPAFTSSKLLGAAGRTRRSPERRRTDAGVALHPSPSVLTVCAETEPPAACGRRSLSQATALGVNRLAWIEGGEAARKDPAVAAGNRTGHKACRSEWQQPGEAQDERGRAREQSGHTQEETGRAFMQRACSRSAVVELDPCTDSRFHRGDRQTDRTQRHEAIAKQLQRCCRRTEGNEAEMEREQRVMR